MIRSFIEALNAQIKTSLCEKAACFYGLTQPGLLKDGKRTPVYFEGREARRINPTDTDPVTIYHRHLGLNTESRGEGPGDTIIYHFTLNCRLFGLATLDQLDEGCSGGGEGLAFAVWDAIPRQDKWTATNASGLRLRTDNMQTDTKAILQAEFTGLDESKINALTCGAFSINYRIMGRFCGDWCDIGTVTYGT